MARPTAVGGIASRVVLAGVVLVSFVVLFAPGSDVPPSAPGVDKFVHAGLFLALAVSGLWAGARRWVLVGVLLVYAGASELIQTIPALQRDGSVFDWLADAAGTLLGLAVWLAADRRATRR